MILTADRVNLIFMDCLFQEGECTTQHVKTEGITTNVGFHPERLRGHQQEIVELLNDLPEEFKESEGGGWSFLNACNDKHGNQWTGSHQTMERLFLLGLGIGKVKCVMPRQFWGMLPGGVPYYVVLDMTEEEGPWLHSPLTEEENEATKRAVDKNEFQEF